MSHTKRYKKGHFIGLALATCIPMGVLLGLALGNIALGHALGLLIGLCVGVIMEKQLYPVPMIPTEVEVRHQKSLSLIGLSFGLVVMVILIAFYFYVCT